MRYRAFISYSHQDAHWARWLHRRLEGYRIPARLRGSVGEFGPLPDRLSPIFRDREELASAGELNPKIEAALADSEALIVICSPASAHSSWVDGEILSFKRSGRADRIYCLIVDGEPNAGGERECFAPALRYKLDADGELGAPTAEPVAADVRPDKDGKALARMKLLSGLLGVDLDTLRRREAARRQRRWMAITALAVAVMLVTGGLAVQAVIARHAAERRQKQAEALVDFMLGNLTDKLTEVSRLDIMESVNDQAMDYFQSLPVTDVTEQSLEQRVTMLTKIGNVRRGQGHLPDALQSYRAAEALSARLANAAPNNIQRQLIHAEILTFIGTSHWYQGELDRAESGFNEAQRVLQRAKTRVPENPELLYQLSTIDNNLGHVLEGRGRMDDALAQYRNMLASAQQLVRLDLTNRDWKAQSGLAHNNLAKMALLNGDLPAAVVQYKADIDIQSSLAESDRKDNDQAEKLLWSRAALGRTLALTGDTATGIQQLWLALDEATRLLSIDTDNTSFLEDAGLYSNQLGGLLRLADDRTDAHALGARGLEIFLRLTKQDPANAGWQRELAEVRLELGQQAYDAGDTAGAREQARQASSILEPQLAQQSEDRATVLAALRSRLLMAAVTADAATATELRKKTLRTARTQISGHQDPRLLALQIESLLAMGQTTEARSVLPALWATGFRDPYLIALLHRQRIQTPTTIASPTKRHE
ncbi:MAG: TIR domain-containing protein [Luteimonas sp.]